MGQDNRDADSEREGSRKTKVMNTIIIVFFIITIGLLLFLFTLYAGIRAQVLAQNCSSPLLNKSFQILEIPQQAPSAQAPLPNQTNNSS